MSKQNEVRNEVKCMLQYQNLSKAKQIESLLRVRPMSNAEIKIEINKNKPYRILILVCELFVIRSIRDGWEDFFDIQESFP